MSLFRLEHEDEDNVDEDKNNDDEDENNGDVEDNDNEDYFDPDDVDQLSEASDDDDILFGEKMPLRVLPNTACVHSAMTAFLIGPMISNS